MAFFINTMIHYNLYLRVDTDSNYAVIQGAIHILQSVLHSLFQILYVPEVSLSSFYLWASLTIR